MTFTEAMQALKTTLGNIGTTIDDEAFDGLIVKKLAATNTLGDGRGGTHQAHIAITGTQMDIFPYVRSESYFTENDGDMKRYFVLQVPVFLSKSNIEYLAGGTDHPIFFAEDNKKESFTTVLRSKRTDGSEQAEVSTVRTDGPDFIEFRRMLVTGSYLVFIKEKNKLSYYAFGIKETDAAGISELNNNFYKANTSTAVHVGNTITRHYDTTTRKPDGNNTLLYGVPGSGKSWTIEHEYCHADSKVERLVFHPDYTNADFIGQILPVVDEDKQVTYEFVPGPFTMIMREAYLNPMREHILIIEEVNRGNAPAIFGEVFQLLDRKVAPDPENDDGTPVGTSEYGITHKYMAEYIYGDPGHKVRIPSNLSLIGTMNTSDQNVFTLDTAFQRRWRMRLIENNFDNVRASLADAQILDTGVSWKKFCDTINKLIVGNKAKMASAEDKRLGVYFMHETDLVYDHKTDPSNPDVSLQDEYNSLLRAERLGTIDETQKARLKDIRAGLIHNRQFPEKVIKYLWDDAFKFNPEVLFDTGENKMDSLEKVISTFVYSSGRDRFSIFRDTVRQKLYEHD